MAVRQAGATINLGNSFWQVYLALIMAGRPIARPPA